MLEYIVGDYQKKAGDIILDKFYPIYKNPVNQHNIFIIFDEAKLEKQAIEFMKNSELQFKIIASNKKSLNGMRSSKGLKVTDEHNDKSINPFEIAADIIGMQDREFLRGFLLEHRIPLFVIIKHLSGNFSKLSEANRKVIMWVDFHLFRVDYEILVDFLCHYIRPQPIGQWDLKWNYPKKEEKSEE